MKIIADDKIPYLQGVLEPYAEVSYYPGNEISPDKVKDADALIVRTRTKCNASLLDGSKVRYIASATIGFDHIDTEYCDSKGIKWTNAPGCNSSSVMQYIASAIVHLSTKCNFSFSDKTLGIIGVGNVGSKVARMASILGMNVLLNDPPRERIEGECGFVPIENILANADMITFHVPLNFEGEDKTFHLLNDDFLSKIKPETIVLNSSRGEVVSSAVLKKGLQSQKIGAAVLDVWENEPDIDLELLNLVDLATPHIAGYSADGKANGTIQSVQALSNHFDLSLDDWIPEVIAAAPEVSFDIDCYEMGSEEILKQAIHATYNIEKDDKTLRKSPRTFEEQRDNYPLRREFQAHFPRLKNDSKDVGRVLNMLGFSTKIKYK